MLTVSKQVIEKQVVTLDGHKFEDCTFVECPMIFSGMAPHVLKDCKIQPNLMLQFVGPAQATLQFLSSMYRANPDGKALVDKIFQSIRDGLQPSPAAPAPMPTPNALVQ